ncbi:phosphate ABC transporter permease subunit PstC [Nocardioides bruguierae]|uniref:Phosphate transport system permease protein n=1 Tax=Nocardioides bruguierae TaxID=2945102 RepID=A0A9X2IG15_9ACTN|nr:phosphate ABC transporter permease subunit PstC [Nocardioides bruguierae]MCL8026218.1 phosphate ABC transporter permease subunit PstC [Nocardioides bruguierae]MCM0621563.1 phosphate ABC transporter permease subunit PstC [Nocardioides bruguierae]
MTDPETDLQPIGSTSRAGDTIFRGLATASAVVIVLALAGVAAFLLAQGLPALDGAGARSYGYDNIWVYTGPLLFGTLLASVIAMIVATPLAIGVALIISHYAPRRFAKGLGWLIDLLAAIPSVIFGMWGIEFVARNMVPVYNWLNDYLGFIPLFAGPVPTSGRTMMTAGLVLGVMALPIITAICREIFAQTPVMHQEAALALGATRWEMIRLAVFPYASSGMVSAILLGLGRALGETMAVALVLSPSIVVSFNLLTAESGSSSSTIAANIALNFGNASGSKVDALIFTGLVLFVITFAVNFLGRWVAARAVKKG